MLRCENHKFTHEAVAVFVVVVHVGAIVRTVQKGLICVQTLYFGNLLGWDASGIKSIFLPV